MFKVGCLRDREKMGKGKKAQHSGERRTITKSTFGTPFKNFWPDVEKNVNRRIIEEIKREMPERLTKENPSRKTKGQMKASDANICEGECQTKLYYKDYLEIGINQVTKALEKGPLLLVMVCKSAKPISMTNHLKPLCAMRDTQGCCLSGVSETLGSIFGLSSVLAVGFKVRENHPLADLIAFVKDKIPSLHVPWVEVWKQDTGSSVLRSSGQIADARDENAAKERTEQKNDEFIAVAEQQNNKNMAITSENEEKRDNNRISSTTSSKPNVSDSERYRDLCDSRAINEDSKQTDDEKSIVSKDSNTKGNEKTINSENEVKKGSGNEGTKELVDDERKSSSKDENKCAENNQTMDCNDSLPGDESQEKTPKRKLDDVGYSLIDTNFKMIEVVVPQKKQNIKK